MLTQQQRALAARSAGGHRPLAAAAQLAPRVRLKRCPAAASDAQWTPGGVIEDYVGPIEIFEAPGARRRPPAADAADSPTGARPPADRASGVILTRALARFPRRHCKQAARAAACARRRSCGRGNCCWWRRRPLRRRRGPTAPACPPPTMWRPISSSSSSRRGARRCWTRPSTAAPSRSPTARRCRPRRGARPARGGPRRARRHI